MTTNQIRSSAGNSDPPRRTRNRPTILLIDDELAEAEAQRDLLRGPFDILTRLPEDVTDDDLASASVVLVDLKLDHWTAHAGLPVSLKPDDGIALTAVLRSHLSAEGRSTSPKVFALNSGQLDELSPDMPSGARRPAIARTYNLEWAFKKTETGPIMVRQLSSLANAVESLIKLSSTGTSALSESQIRRLLAVPMRASWQTRASEDIFASRPPLTADPIASAGVSFLRWLLHEVLPYPCFLLEDRYVAARLQVSVESLREVAADSKKTVYNRVLGKAEYSGILGDFLGRRWWRSGVEASLWDLTSGKPFDSASLRKAVKSISGKLEPVDLVDPVVSVDPTGQPSDMLIALSEAVEVGPAGWPDHAEKAWVSLEAARQDPYLRAMVVEHERDRLSAGRHSS